MGRHVLFVQEERGRARRHFVYVLRNAYVVRALELVELFFRQAGGEFRQFEELVVLVITGPGQRVFLRGVEQRFELNLLDHCTGVGGDRGQQDVQRWHPGHGAIPC